MKWQSIGVFLLVGLSGWAQNKNLCSIQGRITGASGEPLRKIELTLVAEGPAEMAYAATSGADGSFPLDEIPAANTGSPRNAPATSTSPTAPAPDGYSARTAWSSP